MHTRMIPAAATIMAVMTLQAPAATITMVCELRGGQETPPVSTAAYGSGRFIIDTTANTMTYYIAFGGLGSAEVAAHIHGMADAGGAAGVLHHLPVGNPKIGVWNYSESQEADILAGKTYVNIHTVNHGGGEIRGQINHFAAALDAAQENPAVAAPASKGWATFNIDTCNNLLHYHIVVESLTSAEVDAHIHGYALPGSNAGVVHGLPLGNVKTGTWNYPESAELMILNGLTYVNIHTVNHGGGEIRGQIVNTIVPIDGMQETPPVVTSGFGNGFIAFNRTTHTLGYYFTFAGLSSGEIAAHLHGYARPGSAAGVVHDLGIGMPKKGTWNYTAANAANVLAGLTYINIHTVDFGGGEIRGQIFPASMPCAGDVNCDLVVNVNDLLGVIGSWGPCAAAPLPCPADRNYDGLVNVNDLLTVIGSWGPCP